MLCIFIRTTKGDLQSETRYDPSPFEKFLSTRRRRCFRRQVRSPPYRRRRRRWVLLRFWRGESEGSKVSKPWRPRELRRSKSERGTPSAPEASPVVGKPGRVSMLEPWVFPFERESGGRKRDWWVEIKRESVGRRVLMEVKGCQWREIYRGDKWHEAIFSLCFSFSLLFRFIAFSFSLSLSLVKLSYCPLFTLIFILGLID